MGNYNTYSGTSIAQQLLGNSWLGRLLYGKPETYKDGYGTERQHASLSESANGQELQRMGDTAKTAGKIALTGFAFTNPFTASSTASSLLGTLGQSYFLGEGLKDAKYRIQNGSTAGDGVMLGLDLLPATSVAKTVFNGAKNIGPALKQIVKNAEYADYMGRLNDASKYNPSSTITNVAGTSDVIKSRPYARIAPSDGRINSAVNYNLRYDPKNFVQVISDTEPGYYSVHFKTEKGSPTSNNIQQVVDQIVSDLPGGSRLATWGTVSKGGFSGLDRFAKAGMIKTGEYRPLTFKDQSVANEVAEKYGLTLNADGTINWPVRRKLYDPQPLSKAELAGLPKVERNQPYKPTTWLQGDDAVNMFKTYGSKEPVVQNSPLMEQIRKYVPEARERYGLWGNTNITDDEIAGALYKRAFQLSGKNNGAVNAYGEPIILFRGDTQRYPIFKERSTPEQVALLRGTMDNSLGTLFLGEYPGSRSGIGGERYLGSYYSLNSKVGRFGGRPHIENSGTGAKSKLDEDIWLEDELDQMVPLGNGIYKLKGSDMTSGVNDMNAFIARTPRVRDASNEISVLEDQGLTQGLWGSEPHMSTKYIEDETGFPMFLHPDGTTTPALLGYDNRQGMAEHYRYILDDALSKNQGLLMSRPNAPLRSEHEDFTYYALPNFNRHNAKHLLGYDLNYPLENSWMLYRKNGGKIHIKEKNKGKFTKAAKAAGESVQEHAHNVINDSNATTLQKKRAQFAINAKKWHK